MFTLIPLTRDRNTAINAFDTLRFRAAWAKLSRRQTRLESFSKASRASVNKKFVGVQEIPVDKIVGTIGREGDFDNRFRPLHKHLRDRWVDVFLSLSTEAWSPIRAHKVGEQYFVEDGHHRTSVARAVGMAYIQAEIWEYSTQPTPVKLCQPVNCCSTRRLGGTCPA
ncbi:MAG: hypothetical protein JW963_02650 [Anaerolineales bacterium]|nr:hypothetical protein [Anaerolineales bacterium]